MEIEGTKIVAVQWSAILDMVTCELCEELDGQIGDINDSELAGIEPPLHNYCRCIKAYIGEDELPENWIPDFKKPSPDLIERFANFKAVPSDSLKKFLKSDKGREIIEVKPPEVDDIIKYLKVGRGQMLRKGKK